MLSAAAAAQTPTTLPATFRDLLVQPADSDNARLLDSFVFIDPFADLKEPEDSLALTRLLDMAPDAEPAPTGNRLISQVYRELLDSIEWAITDSTGTAEKVKKLRESLYVDDNESKPVPAYKRFREIRDELSRLVDRSSKPESVSQEDKLRLQTLRADLASIDAKHRFSDIEQQLQRLSAPQGAAIGRELLKTFEDLKQRTGSGQAYWPVEVLSIGALFGEGSEWTAVSTKLGKEPDAQTLEWRVSSPGREAIKTIPPAVAPVAVSMELVALQLNRPWLSREVFADRRWRFAKGKDQTPVSSSSLPRSAQRLPRITARALFVRNLRIQLNNISPEHRRSLRDGITSGQEIRLGPFVLAGRAFSSPGGPYLSPVIRGTTIVVPHVQFVGWMTAPIPAPSPNPDKSLKWPE